MTPELEVDLHHNIATEEMETSVETTYWRETILFFNCNILHSGAAQSHLQ